MNKKNNYIYCIQLADGTVHRRAYMSVGAAKGKITYTSKFSTEYENAVILQVDILSGTPILIVKQGKDITPFCEYEYDNNSRISYYKDYDPCIFEIPESKHVDKVETEDLSKI